LTPPACRSPKLELLRRGGALELFADGRILSTSQDWIRFRRISRPAPEIVLVGLGLGGSTRYALRALAVERLLVIERLPAVVELFRRRHPVEASDPRLEILVAEFPGDLPLEDWTGDVYDLRFPRPVPLRIRAREAL